MLIVTYNIQFGCGRDRRIDIDRIARTIADADVAILQEVERNWREGPHSDQAARLGELMPGHHWVHGATTDLDGSRKGAHGRITNIRRRFGNMILSRRPIVSTRTVPLPTLPVSGHINDQSSLLEAVIDNGERPFRVYNIHLNHISRRQRLMQLAIALPFIADSAARGGMITAPNFKGELSAADWLALPGGKLPAMPSAAIFAGDFNSATDGPEYDLLTGPLDPVFGRITEADRFADALTLSGLPESEGATFPASNGKPAARIDHCLVSIDLIARVKRAWIELEIETVPPQGDVCSKC